MKARLHVGALDNVRVDDPQPWDALRAAYRVLGLASVTRGDKVFRDLISVRIIEPTSKVDADRVLTQVGVQPAGLIKITV